MAFVSNAGLSNVMAAWEAFASRPQWIQYGTGAGQDITSNDLSAPVESRVLANTTQETTTTAGDTFRMNGTLYASSANTITEVGVFDASTGGNMDVYGDDFTGIGLAVGDAIVFSISVTVAQGA